MLIGLPPLLGPELLFTLRAMGHGDEIALVDGNYPAQEHARRLVRADGHGLRAVLEAILQVLPIETAGAGGVFRASLDNDPGRAGPFHHAIDAACAARGLAVTALSGTDLYPRIRAAHTIVATSETALFANVILRKGVIPAGGAEGVVRAGGAEGVVRAGGAEGVIPAGGAGGVIPAGGAGAVIPATGSG